MHTENISISLSKSMVYFLEYYQQAYELQSRSEVIKKALILLQQTELKQQYNEDKETSKTVDSAFDTTVSDGLDDET